MTMRGSPLDGPVKTHLTWSDYAIPGPRHRHGRPGPSSSPGEGPRAGKGPRCYRLYDEADAYAADNRLVQRVRELDMLKKRNEVIREALAGTQGDVRRGCQGRDRIAT
ncbi:hypothetical protein AB0M95_00430 [Sphaerisporangium sp. NPDC051017]|uniref:hypothetical protein n=1 Tax=Sphaerisporangium sp. NPDC051017 TaxID=3154636 RepID=UPI0034166526